MVFNSGCTKTNKQTNKPITVEQLICFHENIAFKMVLLGCENGRIGNSRGASL